MDSYTQFLPKNPVLAHFDDSDTEIHVIQICITEVYPVFLH